MKCDGAQQQIVLQIYGELDDDLSVGLERHLAECDSCRRYHEDLLAMGEHLARLPVLDPSPNLLAACRVRLDEALDGEGPHGLGTRLRANLFRWFGFLESAPALAVLLVGVGFLGGDFTLRYRLAHTPHLPPAVVVTNTEQGAISNVSGIVQTPHTDLVQVKYNRIVPEVMEGSLDDPQIRHLLLVGMRSNDAEAVRTDSVALLSTGCRQGRTCSSADDSAELRSALLERLRADKDAGVRLKALEGLEPFVNDHDQHVRDGVLEALMTDSSPAIRKQAIVMLGPVQQDSSVRQVLRTLSRQDQNPFIRTASYQALQGSDDLQ